ncbi:exonuclease domain-containing protein [Austwickia chelonae]|nr:exonuclease domain-containing protein [Austwickia chelonae]
MRKVHLDTSMSVRTKTLADLFLTGVGVGVNRLRGITREMVANAPRRREILPEIVERIGSDPVVAHNAAFDISVIREACAVDELPCPSIDFLCTPALSKAAFALPSYRLPFVSQACGFEMTNHHEALADARAVIGIVDHPVAAAGVSSLVELAEHHRVAIGLQAKGLPVEVMSEADFVQHLAY